MSGRIRETCSCANAGAKGDYLRKALQNVKLKKSTFLILPLLGGW